MTDGPHAAAQARWRKNIDALPDNPDKIPAFFLAHGSPMLAFDPSERSAYFGDAMVAWAGPQGPLALFLRDFGPALMKKYKPRGIVVFSAHWETYGERAVTDYGDENPLLYDYYGFPPELYRLKFKSRGDSALTQQVLDHGHKVRTTTKLEARGDDGRGFPGPGLDHGVFVPFRLMFGEEIDIPIVEASIDGSLDPAKNWEVGKALSKLRKEGILIIAGGLTAHNLRDVASFAPSTARPAQKDFDKAVLDAVALQNPEKRKESMLNLVKHPGFRSSHPREEHFIPLYVAAGAGDGANSVIVSDTYGSSTIAFDV
ncbi:Extradiol aromatic ring-opening dioxygenase [Fistulina hepatica ATCC 64428]|nr:Extradiol aromatic ring-opening dioxygenase [Fistulina hepatica ATCC 64428]